MILIDDVGSFPLPENVTRDQVSKAAIMYARAFARGLPPDKIAQNKFILHNLVLPVQQAFETKLATGIDLPNYPQFRDMNTMFLDLLEDGLTVKKELAIIPEVVIINEWAASRTERIDLRICITGAVELAVTKFGTHGLNSMVINRLCRAVNTFYENLEKYCGNVNVGLVSLDEPSIGLRDFPPSITDEYITSVLDCELGGVAEDVPVNIHMHSLARLEPVLATQRINYIGAEFAADPSNYAMLDGESLRKHGKKIRAGIASSSLDSLVLKHAEKNGIDPGLLFKNKETLGSVMETEEVMRSRLEDAINAFGSEMVPIAGPDCGLISWKYPELASKLLTTVKAAVRTSSS